MASASISGLGSGLDTASIIDQVHAARGSPADAAQVARGLRKSVVSLLQALNTKVAALATRAADLAKPGGLTAITATSSDTKVAVTATGAAGPGGFSVRVDQTAASHRLELANAVGLATPGSVPTALRLDRLDGSAPVDVTSDGTLAGLVNAINDPASATGLRATAVKVGTDQYRLVVESATSGAAGDFTLTSADGSELLGGATVRAGRDAKVTIGDTVVATSATNTFADLVPGVSITLAADAPAGTSRRSR